MIRHYDPWSKASACLSLASMIGILILSVLSASSPSSNQDSFQVPERKMPSFPALPTELPFAPVLL